MTEPTGNRIVLRHIVGPVICAVAGLGFLAGAPTVAVNISSGVVLGILGAAVLIFGLVVLLSVTEIQADHLTVRGPGRRRTVLLSELASAEIVVITYRGTRNFALQLRDQQGTTAVLTPGGYPRGQWRQALTALAPYILAPGVKRAGQIDEALSGSLWRRR